MISRRSLFQRAAAVIAGTVLAKLPIAGPAEDPMKRWRGVFLVPYPELKSYIDSDGSVWPTPEEFEEVMARMAKAAWFPPRPRFILTPAEARAWRAAIDREVVNAYFS